MIAQPAHNEIVVEQKIRSKFSGSYKVDTEAVNSDEIFNKQQSNFSKDISFLRYNTPWWSGALSNVIIDDDTITVMGNYELRSLPWHYEKNIDCLKSSFLNEVQTRDNISSLQMEYIRSEFDKVSLALAELPFRKGIVEITQSNDLKFSILFQNNTLVLITKDINQEGNLEKDEIVFSIFINRELIMSDVSTTTNFIEGFKRFLKM